MLESIGILSSHRTREISGGDDGGRGAQKGLWIMSKALNVKRGADSQQRRVMPTVEELNRNFATAFEIRLHEEYLRGKMDGLRIAKLIRGRLTRQPDRAWQKQVREWADKAIANAER
jgi:hypothetical protein